MSNSSNDDNFIQSNSLDPNFKDEVANEHGGDQLKYCYQCGTCAAGCPIRTITSDFNPRTIIRKILLGMREEVLNTKEIWICSNCYICYERCPQDVRFTDIIFALRNIAAREGKIHPSYTKQVELIQNKGRLYELTDFEIDERDDYDMPELQAESDDLKTLFEKTKIWEKISTKKKEEEEK